MNYFGSFRHLIRNGKSAMVSAIEIYNKPRIDYREECFVILQMNAWELLLKAILSKNRQSIYYPKRKQEPYRTLSWVDAFKSAQAYFPGGIDSLPIRRNLEALSEFRDNAVHFYNERSIASIIHALAQTSIINFKDLLLTLFSIDLAHEINWHLLPLGLNPPIDPIEYISGKARRKDNRNSAIDEFVSRITRSTKEIEDAMNDTGRFLTVYQVHLISRKKIEDADLVVGVSAPTPGDTPVTVVRNINPNVTHPLRQTDVLQKVREVQGCIIGTYQFQAIVWKYGIKDNDKYCWRAKSGILVTYSNDILPWIRRLKKKEIEDAIKEYKKYLKKRRLSAQGRG